MAAAPAVAPAVPITAAAPPPAPTAAASAAAPSGVPSSAVPASAAAAPASAPASAAPAAPGAPAAAGAPGAAGGAVPGAPPPKPGVSEEVSAILQADKDIVTMLKEVERRISNQEAAYIHATAPSAGNLISGWEPILEGKTSHDKKRASERIFSGASVCVWGAGNRGARGWGSLAVAGGWRGGESD
jgi:hypothetical protein